MSAVMITGASSGIGAQLAQDYVQEGWQVWGSGRGEQADAPYRPLRFDVADLEQCRRAGDQLTAELGTDLDLLILNAGTCEYIDDAQHFDGELFARVIQTNVLGLGYCLDAFLPRLRRGGHVVIVSSSASFIGLPRSEAYGASKAAADYLGRSLAVDLAPYAIDVSVVSPGFVRTPLTAKNDFPMPFAIDAQQSSREIRRGIARRKRHIRSPWGFTTTLLLLGLLPRSVQALIGRRLSRASDASNANKPEAL